MSDWMDVTVEECCDILDSQRIPVNGEERSKRMGDTPYYGANGLQGYIDGFIFDEPLILLAEDGGYFDEFATRPVAYRIAGKSWVNNHAHVLRAKNGYDQSFVFYSLEHKDMTPFIKGGTRAKLNQWELRQVKIASPSLPEQHKIARILSTVDKQIEKTEELIAKYQSIKQGMMHDLFTRGVDQNGRLRPPQLEAPDLYKQSPLGWLPKEWESHTINDLATRVGSGITPTGGSEVYLTEGVIFIRSQNVKFSGLDLTDVAYIDEVTHHLMAGSEVFPYDVLINITGASIGRCCCMPDGLGKTNSNQHVCCIRLADSCEEDAKYLATILSSPIGQNQVFCLNAGGNREGLNYQQIRSFIVPWSKKQERIQVSALLSTIQKSLESEYLLLEKLKEKKTGLMQDLLTGAVRVSVEE